MVGLVVFDTQKRKNWREENLGCLSGTNKFVEDRLRLGVLAVKRCMIIVCWDF